MTNYKPFQTIKEACKTTGLSQHYLREGCKSGSVPHITSGMKYYVNIPALIEKLSRGDSGGSNNGQETKEKTLPSGDAPGKVKETTDKAVSSLQEHSTIHDGEIATPFPSQKRKNTRKRREEKPGSDTVIPIEGQIRLWGESVNEQKKNAVPEKTIRVNRGFQ